MQIGFIGLGALGHELARRSVLADCDILISNPMGDSIIKDSVFTSPSPCDP